MAELIALVFAGAASYGLVTVARRWVAKRERIAACNHIPYLVDGEFPTYFCARECGWQEPARDVYEQRAKARIERCPRCGGQLDD